MHHRGFTLVELVTVLILISILAVTLGPRFIGSGSNALYTERALLQARLRRVQLDALNQSSSCHQMLLLADRYGPPDLSPCSVSASFLAGYFTADSHLHRSGVLADVQLAGAPIDLRFDALGRPGGDCAGGCTLTLQQNGASLGLMIEAEGFIHVP